MPAVLCYLDQFAELPAVFPEKSIVVALALYAKSCDDEPDKIGIIKRLLPKLSMESLLAIVAHQKSKVRVGALRLLAEYPGAIPLEPILAMLHDPDPQVRCEAIKCLHKRSDTLPVHVIVACLQDTSAQVCVQAISVLASLGAQAPVADLMVMLDSPMQEVRSAAIQALTRPGLFERVPTEVFVNALGESHYWYDEEYHRNVLQVLCNKDLPVAIEHCIAALGDSNDTLALVAFQLLQQIHPAIIPDIMQEALSLFQGGKPGRFFRTLSASFLADIIGDIGHVRSDLIAYLGELLDWPYWGVREEAAQALGKLRRNIPDAIIRRLLALRHDVRSRAVREAADTALAEILSLETGIEDD